MIDAITTALSGLLASTNKAAAASGNIANANTTGSLADNAAKKPYTPVDSVQSSSAGGGVSTTIVNRTPPFVPAYDPSSPFADEGEIIGSPNIRLEEEVVTLKQAELSYKANLKVLQTASDMQDELIDSINTKA